MLNESKLRIEVKNKKWCKKSHHITIKIMTLIQKLGTKLGSHLQSQYWHRQMHQTKWIDFEDTRNSFFCSPLIYKLLKEIRHYLCIETRKILNYCSNSVHDYFFKESLLQRASYWTTGTSNGHITVTG